MAALALATRAVEGGALDATIAEIDALASRLSVGEVELSFWQGIRDALPGFVGGLIGETLAPDAFASQLRGNWWDLGGGYIGDLYRAVRARRFRRP